MFLLSYVERKSKEPEGKQQGFGSDSRPLCSLRNDQLSLEFGGGPDSTSLNLFVTIASLSEPLMSLCPPQMDEKPLCY